MGEAEDEMMRSIDEVDAERTRIRKTVAKQIRDLGIQYDELTAQVNEVLQQLRTAITTGRKHFDGLDELAVHTKRDLPELTAWSESNETKATRQTKRSKPAPAGKTAHRGGRPSGSGSSTEPSSHSPTSQVHPSTGPALVTR